MFAELTPQAVLAKARLADRFMARLMHTRPRIGICALNPHGGEGGLFGDEESRILRRRSSRGWPKGWTCPARCRPTP